MFSASANRDILLLTRSNAWGRRLEAAVTAEARARGLPWLLHVTERPEASLDLFRRLKPDGALLLHPGADLLRLVKRRGAPCVLASGPDAAAADWPLLRTDQAAVGALGARHLAETGARSFGFAGLKGSWFSEERESSFRERLGGLCGARVEAGPTLEGDAYEEPVMTYRFTDAGRRMRDWIRSLEKPCAVMAATDRAAHVLALAALDAGLRIPRDVAILGVDDEPRHCLTLPCPLSSIRPPAGRMGAEAARLLSEWFDGRRPRSGIRLFPPVELIRRESTTVRRVHDAAVAKTLRRIESQAARPLRVADLAKQSGVGRRTLELRFKAALGRTPLMEIRRRRVEIARRLLEDTRHPVAEIARLSGFNSAVRFCIVFKELTGQTPGACRRAFEA